MNAKELKSFLTDQIELDDLVLAKDALITLDRGYQELGVDTPEWITDKLAAVSNEIVSRNRAELQRQLRAAKARRAALSTREEHRQAE